MQIFETTGCSDPIGFWLRAQRFQKSAAIFLMISLLVLIPDARAQSSDTLAPSPDRWLVSKAEVEDQSLDGRRIVGGKNNSLLKIIDEGADKSSGSRSWALKFSDASAISRLEKEIVALYGAPIQKNGESKVWKIRHSDPNGTAHFVLTYQTLPNRDVIVRVESDSLAEPRTNEASGKL